jgi:hypothetical protein
MPEMLWVVNCLGKRLGNRDESLTDDLWKRRTSKTHKDTDNFVTVVGVSES